MKHAMLTSLWLVAVLVLLLCCTPAAFADNTKTFAITTTDGSLWGEDTSPYGTDHAGNVVCDDIRDTVYINSEYQYKEVSANSIIAAGGGGIWPGSPAPSQVYAAAAYLIKYDIGFTLGGGMNQDMRVGRFGLFFDPSLANSKIPNNDQAGCKAIFGSEAWNGSICNYTRYSDGLIGTALANGLAAYNAGAFGNLVVYVPHAPSGSGWCTPSDSSCQAQEFWGVPDGGSALQYLLLVVSGCFGVIYSRRRGAKGGLA